MSGHHHDPSTHNQHGPMTLEERYRAEEENVAYYKWALQEALDRQFQVEHDINLPEKVPEVFYAEEEWAPVSRNEIERGIEHINQLQQQLNRVVAKLDVQEKANHVLCSEKNVAEIEAAQVALQTASINTETQVANLKAQIASLIKAKDDAINEAAESKKKHQESHADFTKKFNAVKKERDEAQAAALKKPQVGLNQQLEQLKKERDAAVAEAAKDKKKLDDGFANFTRKFNEAKKERDDAQRSLNTTRANFNKQFNDVKVELDRVNQRLNTGRQAFTKKENELAAAQWELAKLRRQLAGCHCAEDSDGDSAKETWRTSQLWEADCPETMF